MGDVLVVSTTTDFASEKSEKREKCEPRLQVKDGAAALANF